MRGAARLPLLLLLLLRWPATPSRPPPSSLRSVRYGGCEPHAVAALIGGIAGQEAVKLLTHQYLPLDNTYIFNGITGEAATLSL